MKADHRTRPDEFDTEDRMVAVRYFAQEPEARVYAARLKAAGIRSYLSNTYALSTLPLAGSGIGLHVREADLPEVLRVFIQMDRESRQTLADQSFHDADLDEIQYQKELHASRLRTGDKVLLALVILLIMVFSLRALLIGFDGRAIEWLRF